MWKLRFRALAAALVVPALLSGCGDDGPTTPSVVGTYTLQQVNGSNVPGVLFEDADLRLEIIGGSLTLTAAKSYSEPITFRFTDKATGDSQTGSETDTGTYSVSGSTIAFTSSDPDVGRYSGTVSGGTITYSLEGFTATYRR